MKKKYDISKDELKDWLSEDGTEPKTTEVKQSEDALAAFAKAHAIAPPNRLREKILGKINLLSTHKQQKQSFDINNLPLLDESANWLEWQEAIKSITPPDDYENAYLHPLEINEKRELYVAWVKEFIEEEVHHDLLESFLLLEGSCECHITDEKGNTRIVRMTEGDFIAIPLRENHDVIVTSLKPAKAILQWKKMAA